MNLLPGTDGAGAPEEGSLAPPQGAMRLSGATRVSRASRCEVLQRVCPPRRHSPLRHQQHAPAVGKPHFGRRSGMRVHETGRSAEEAEARCGDGAV